MNNKNKALIALGIIIIFGIGFVSGMEYKAYQIRSAIGDAFNSTNSSTTPTEAPIVEQAKKEAENIIEKQIGEEVALATGNIIINSSEETQTLSGTYGSPKVAKERTKFVVINLDVTNTTKSEFYFSPDDVFILQDDKKREYRTYSESIGAIDDYLNYQDLAPSIKETGFILYEIPEDATSYSLVTSKAGTKDIYLIKLK